MKIEQRDLAYFAVIAEHGHIGRAAAALGLTQPALSMSLRRLEHATGTKVVRRTGTGIELADAGELDLVLARGGDVVDDEIVEEPLSESEFVVCCSRHHRLARARRVACADLVNERWLISGGALPLARLQSTVQKQGLPAPKVAVTALLPELRLRVVAATQLLGQFRRATVEEAAKRLGLVVLRVEDCTPARLQAALFYRKGAYLSPAVRRFMDLLRRARGPSG